MHPASFLLLLFALCLRVESFVDPDSDVIESPDRRLLSLLLSRVWDERDWFVTSAVEQVRAAGGDVDAFYDVFVASIVNSDDEVDAMGSEDDVIMLVVDDVMSASCPRCRVC